MLADVVSDRLLALPEAMFGVGVKVAVRVTPLPLRLLSVPPMVLMSPSINPVGSSLKVKVMVAVSPILRVDTLLVIASVGARVSMLMLGLVPAAPLLAAASL